MLAQKIYSRQRSRSQWKAARAKQVFGNSYKQKATRAFLVVILLLSLGAAALWRGQIRAATIVQMSSPSGGEDGTVLENTIKNAPNGSTFVFPQNAQYIVNDGIRINGARDLVINGNGSRFMQTQVNANKAWEIFSSTNITIHNVHVIGSLTQFAVTGNYSFEGQHAFSIRSTVGFTLYDVTSTNTNGDGLCICAPLAGSSTTNQNVHVYNYRFEKTGRHAIAIVGGQNIVIENGYIGPGNVGGLQIEGNGTGGGAVGVVFRNNDVGLMGRGFVHFGGRQGSRNEDILVANNRLHDMDMYTRGNTTEPGVRKKNIRFIGNVSNIPNRSSLANGNSIRSIFLFADTDGLEIRDNVQPLQSNVQLADALNSTAVVISGNAHTFVGYPGSGIKAGDLNGDGTVNALDLSTILTNYGKTGQTRSQGDINGDSTVNGLDLSQVLTNYGA